MKNVENYKIVSTTHSPA